MYGGTSLLDNFPQSADVYRIAVQQSDPEFSSAVAEALRDHQACSSYEIRARVNDYTRVGDPLVRHDQEDPFPGLNRGRGVVVVMTISISVKDKHYTAKGIGYLQKSSGLSASEAQKKAEEWALDGAKINLACKALLDHLK
jgi:hypothetical protein